MTVIEHWTGQTLYVAWCGSPHSDLAAYWRGMNIAEQAKWAKLAALVNQQHEGAVARIAELEAALDRAAADLIAWGPRGTE